MASMHLASTELLDALRDEYRSLVADAEEELQQLALNRRQLHDQDMHRIRRHLLVTERDQVMQAFRQGAIGRKSQERLLADIDARLLSLEAREGPAEPVANVSPPGDRAARAAPPPSGP
jgi:hypothetical protein